MHVLETLKLASILKKDQFNPIPLKFFRFQKNIQIKFSLFLTVKSTKQKLCLENTGFVCVRGYTFNWLIVTLKNVLVWSALEIEEFFPTIWIVFMATLSSITIMLSCHHVVTRILKILFPYTSNTFLLLLLKILHFFKKHVNISIVWSWWFGRFAFVLMDFCIRISE